MGRCKLVSRFHTCRYVSTHTEAHGILCSIRQRTDAVDYASGKHDVPARGYLIGAELAEIAAKLRFTTLDRDLTHLNGPTSNSPGELR